MRPGTWGIGADVEKEIVGPFSRRSMPKFLHIKHTIALYKGD